MTQPHVFALTADGLRLELTSAGAAVHRLIVGEAEVDIALGHRDVATYATAGNYFGATVGRFANRIAGGIFELDGTQYRLPTNELGNSLHGGPCGFDARVWSVDQQHDHRAILTLTSPDGDQGFPGELWVSATYSVEPGQVQIDYVAETDAATVVNLTNHTYFNLDGPESEGIDKHQIEVAASAFLPGDENQLPTGEIAPVEGTIFDLRTPQQISRVLSHDDEQLNLASGLDHTFVVDGTGLRRAARVVGSSGRWLEMYTDAPGVQVYTGGHLDGSVIGLDGEPYGPQSGLALEAQGFPNAPNEPSFPSTVLRPGEMFRRTIVWRVGE